MTKYTKLVKQEFDVKYLKVDLGVRYWEDAYLYINNEKVDIPENGSNIPLKDVDRWVFTIDVETGQVLNWSENTKIEAFFKVCDDGNYYLIDSKFQTIDEFEGIYVPSCLSIDDNGYGDYVFLTIQENGVIKNWEQNFESFVK
jgi:hypothetical protein